MDKTTKQIAEVDGSTLKLKLETIQALPTGSLEYLEKIPRNNLEPDSIPFEVLNSLVEADMVSVENGKVSVKHDYLVVEFP